MMSWCSGSTFTTWIFFCDFGPCHQGMGLGTLFTGTWSEGDGSRCNKVHCGDFQPASSIGG